MGNSRCGLSRTQIKRFEHVSGHPKPLSFKSTVWKDSKSNIGHRGCDYFIGDREQSLVIGLSLDFIGISPIKALIYTAILYGLTSPVLIALILLLVWRGLAS